MSHVDFSCVEADDRDRAWLASESELLGGPMMVSRGRLYDLRAHPAVIVWHEKRRCGLAVYHLTEGELEVLAIRALTKYRGAGSTLLAEMERIARNCECASICLCTTNDNLDALRFYQRRGFTVRAYSVDGFREVLRIKGRNAEQSHAGQHGIPIRDVIELSKPLR
ncbi:MAG: GNAT family N-acetyltransferase [Pseudomonadota bacterium]